MEREEGKEYRSPLRKLASFFEKSRDQWKSKCQEAKYEAKKLKHVVRYHKESKEELKGRIAGLEAQVRELKKREQYLENELEALKKSEEVAL